MTNPNKHSLPALILIICAIALPFTLHGKETLAYHVFFNNNPIGEETYSEEITGEKTIKTVVESNISFYRGNAVVTMIQKGVFIETLDHRPLSFSYYDSSSGKITKELQGKIENNLLTVKSPTHNTVSCLIDPKILFYPGLRDLVKKSITEDKQEFSYSFYSPDQAKIIDVQNSILEKKDGFVTIKSVYKNVPGVEIIEKRDLKGNLVEQEIPALKYKKSLSTGTAKTAGPGEAPRFDIHALNTVETANKNNVRLDSNTVKAIYEITAEGPIDIPMSERQTIEETIDDGIIISIIKIKQENTPAAGGALQTEDIVEYLRSNDFMQTGDDRIKQVINGLNIDGTSKTTDEWVKRIHRWVLDNITVRSLNLNFATALEVLEKKEGDCSEFSVLFGTLLRNVGIPSKICFGLLYVDGLFRYHFWTEFFDEKWYPFDPSRKTGIIDTRYIKLMETSLNDLSGTRLGIRLSTYLRVKKITVLNAINKEGIPNE